MGDNVTLLVTGNGEYFKLYSIVVGRTGVVHNKIHSINTENEEDDSDEKDEDDNEDENNGKKGKQMSIKITATKDMLPVANILVYYIHISGEIIYDRISFKVFPTKNKVS